MRYTIQRLASRDYDVGPKPAKWDTDSGEMAARRVFVESGHPVLAGLYDRTLWDVIDNDAHPARSIAIAEVQDARTICAALNVVHERAMAATLSRAQMPPLPFEEDGA